MNEAWSPRPRLRLAIASMAYGDSLGLIVCRAHRHGEDRAICLHFLEISNRCRRSRRLGSERSKMRTMSSSGRSVMVRLGMQVRNFKTRSLKEEARKETISSKCSSCLSIDFARDILSHMLLSVGSLCKTVRKHLLRDRYYAHRSAPSSHHISLGLILPSFSSTFVSIS